VNVLALLASVALGAPAPAPAAPAAAPAPTVASTATTSGVLGLKWGQGPGKDLGPLETISREVVTGRSVSIQCATTSKLPTDVGDSLQFAKLCYWNQALFEVELQVSDPPARDLARGPRPQVRQTRGHRRPAPPLGARRHEHPPLGQPPPLRPQARRRGDEGRGGREGEAARGEAAAGRFRSGQPGKRETATFPFQADKWRASCSVFFREIAQFRPNAP
jgi:hypothetical protein